MKKKQTDLVKMVQKHLFAYPWTEEEKNFIVTEFLQSGLSYRDFDVKFNVPRSTLNAWVLARKHQKVTSRDPYRLFKKGFPFLSW